MSITRVLVAILTVTVFCAASGIPIHAGRSQPGPVSGAGPALGKWEFTGKDDKGGVWAGTLTIGKLDTERFDAEKYHSIVSLEAESAGSTHAVEAPCRWDPAKREVSFSTGGAEYTATLSPDGKSLTGGKWTDSEKDYRTRKVTVARTGAWSARLTAR